MSPWRSSRALQHLERPLDVHAHRRRAVAGWAGHEIRVSQSDVVVLFEPLVRQTRRRAVDAFVMRARDPLLDEVAVASAATAIGRVCHCPSGNGSSERGVAHRRAHGRTRRRSLRRCSDEFPELCTRALVWASSGQPLPAHDRAVRDGRPFEIYRPLRVDPRDLRASGPRNRRATRVEESSIGVATRRRGPRLRCRGDFGAWSLVADSVSARRLCRRWCDGGGGLDGRRLGPGPVASPRSSLAFVDSSVCSCCSSTRRTLSPSKCTMRMRAVPCSRARA